MFAESASCGVHRKKKLPLFICVWHCLAVAHVLLCDNHQQAGQKANRLISAPRFCMIISSPLAVYVKDGKGRYT